MKNIFIACDTSDPKKINKIIKNTQFKIKGYRVGYKFGLEFFYSIKGRHFVSEPAQTIPWQPHDLAKRACLLTRSFIDLV